MVLTLTAQVILYLLHDMVCHSKALGGAARHTGDKAEHRSKQKIGVGKELDYTRAGCLSEAERTDCLDKPIFINIPRSTWP
jgi:hypothetical protein